jgi:hypothetical protein
VELLLANSSPHCLLPSKFVFRRDEIRVATQPLSSIVPAPSYLLTHLAFRRKASTTETDMVGISDLLDSDLEEAQDTRLESSVLSSASNDTRTTLKRPRKRRCVTMPKAKSRVTKASTAEPKKPGAKHVGPAKRKAAAAHVERIEAEGVDEIQQTQPMTTKPRGRPAGRGKAPEPIKEELDDMIDETMAPEDLIVEAESRHAPIRGTKAKPSARVARTQARATKGAAPAPAMEEDVIVSDQDEMQIDEPAPPRKVSRNASRLGQLSTIRQRRAGSASDSERGDPNLRRKLGDITHKFENVELKYRNLKDVGVGEANANVEKLRKQCEAVTQASNELITALRRELADQAPFVQEGRKLKKQFQSMEIEASELRKSNTQLTTSLSAAQNEIKTLQAKLAAARSASVPIEAPTGRHQPTSSLKPNAASRAGSVALGDSSNSAQMKEELYRDLTGLIVRSVKKTEEGDTYDCIQTGRNGSKYSVSSNLVDILTNVLALHFKLFVDAEEAKTASFQETEFLYTPVLDANRDADLIELMPTYLTEEITFAREDASKFYCRVLDTLTKRRVEEHE